MEMHKVEKFFVNSSCCNFFHKKLIFPSFFKFINKELKGKTLEIGCGIGETTKLLAKKYNKLFITAIDYDKRQIEIAKKHKNLVNVEFQQGDATNLKFKISSFDYVIEANTLHHIKDYQKAIKEVYRTLKNGGTFYLMDISKYIFFIWPFRLFFLPESFFTKKELVTHLKNSGFEVNASRGVLLFFISAKKVQP